MCSLVWVVMSFEELELVEALQRNGRHGLARHTGVVGEYRVGRLISASLDARFEAVGGEEGTGQGHLLVFRARGAKLEAILVVERLGANHSAEFRSEHIGDVAGDAAVLLLGRAATGVLLAHAQDFQADGQRIDDGVGRYRVNAGASAICRGTRDFLTAITGQGDRQRLDRVERRAELQSLAFVRVRELIPAIVDARNQADRIAQRPGRAHTCVGERYGTEQDRAGRVGIGRTPYYFTPLKRDELACDQSERAACVLQESLDDVEHGSRRRRGEFRERMDYLGVFAYGDIDQASEALFRLFWDGQAELTQGE